MSSAIVSFVVLPPEAVLGAQAEARPSWDLELGSQALGR